MTFVSVSVSIHEIRFRFGATLFKGVWHDSFNHDMSPVVNMEDLLMFKTVVTKFQSVNSVILNWVHVRGSRHRHSKRFLYFDECHVSLLHTPSKKVTPQFIQTGWECIIISQIVALKSVVSQLPLTENSRTGGVGQDLQSQEGCNDVWEENADCTTDNKY